MTATPSLRLLRPRAEAGRLTLDLSALLPPDPQALAARPVLGEDEWLHADGLSCPLRPGALLVWRAGAVLRLSSPAAAPQLALILSDTGPPPRGPLPGAHPSPARRHVVLAPDHGLAPLIRALVEACLGEVARLPAEEGRLLRRLGGELLRVVLDEAPPAAAPASPDPAQQRYQRIRRYIVEHLREESLNPRAIAEAHRISLRHLQQLFAEAGTPVAGLIRALRLDACRDALRDPAQARRGIAAIAHDWGFPAPAHFSRVFRQRHGCLPSALRAQDGGRSVRR